MWRLILGIAVCMMLRNAVSIAEESSNEIDPFWVSLHEPAVISELKLTADQQTVYQVMLDRLDLGFFPLRNKAPKESQRALQELIVEARKNLELILTTEQLRRLNQIQFWRMGTASVLHEDASRRIQYSESQRKKIAETLRETQVAVAAIEKQMKSDQTRVALEKKFFELKKAEQFKVVQILKPDQQAAWMEMFGAKFETAKLGNARYKAPEFVNTNEWINSAPLEMAAQRGKVVVLHFYACGCSNCIHNYPTYREWQRQFKGRNVVMIGVHTPETSMERQVSFVRMKATEERLSFPILIDGKGENWDAWGNSMWPCVYLIDKQGYLRSFWAGELKWQGNNGDEVMRERIETLLKEPDV